MTNNAFYFKSKRVVPIIIPEDFTVAHIGISANGNPFTQGSSGVIWMSTNQGGEGPETQGWLPFDLPESVAQLYDQMRLAAIKIKYLPSFPSGGLPLQGYHPAAICYDRDGIEGTLNNQSMQSMMEQVNGVRTFNMFRPWKRYIKFPKYKLRTRIPTMEVQQSGDISANENIAGQWHNPTQPLVDHDFGGSNGSRASQIHIHFERPIDNPETEQIQMGTFIMTTYWVFKDRA